MVWDKKMGKRGRSRFDFYFPNENEYVEVTGYTAKNYKKFSESPHNYEKYIKNIRLKRKYVKNVLRAKFKFIQKILTANEIKLVRKHIL
jgi:hypothetical protein